jgi:acyl-CoA dehydrogenase
MDCAGAAESGTARVVFDDVPLADSDVIGGVGTGFAIAMDVLVEERWVSGITSLAMARHALEDTINWSKHRQVHGKPLHRLQAVQLRLARMKMALLPMDSLALQLADRLTERRTTGTPSLELAGDCAGFKATATSVLVDCLRHAMVLFGGRAFECAYSFFFLFFFTLP